MTTLVKQTRDTVLLFIYVSTYC